MWSSGSSTAGGAGGGTSLRRAALTAVIMRLNTVLELRSLATFL